MRTGIYVYATTTLTIQASEAVTLTALDNNASLAVDEPGRASLAPGIYKAVTGERITVSGDHIDVVVVPNNKDPWPDPPLLAGTALSATKSNLDSFFAIPDAKSIAF